MSSDHRNWQLGLSGGGLRSCAASAVFILAAMHTGGPQQQQQQQQQQQNQESDSQHHQNQQCLWGTFSRVVGVSGGAWCLAALQSGLLQALSSRSTIDDLLLLLRDTLVAKNDVEESGSQGLAAITTAVSASLPSLAHSSSYLASSLSHSIAASAAHRFGEGANIALTSQNPLLDFQKYLENRLMLDDSHEFCSLPRSRRVPCCAGHAAAAASPSTTAHHQQQPHLWISCIASPVTLSEPTLPGDGAAAASSSSSSSAAWSWIAFSLNEHCIRKIHNHTPGTSSSSSNTNIEQLELLPMESMTLTRICCFCGSAFSGTVAEYAAHAGVASSISSSISSLSQSLLSTNNYNSLSSLLAGRPLLGEQTVDRALFACVDTARHEPNPHQQQNSDAASAAVQLRLRDAGLEVNVPFVFTSGNDVTFVLDNGSEGGALGKQIGLAQKMSHIGEYSMVYSWAAAAADARAAEHQQQQQQQRDEAEERDRAAADSAWVPPAPQEGQPQWSAAEASTTTTQRQQHQQQSPQQQQPAVAAEEEQQEVAGHHWGIYLKESESQRGPSVIVYIMGVCGVQTMEVTNVSERIEKLRKFYLNLRTDLTVILNWLTERGF